MAMILLNTIILLCMRVVNNYVLNDTNVGFWVCFYRNEFVL